jgi:hypothetical protein
MKMTQKFKPNILTAFGIIFILMAVIVPIQNLVVWGPDFVYDFYTSSEITAEKISIGVIAMGVVFILASFRKQVFLNQ